MCRVASRDWWHSDSGTVRVIFSAPPPSHPTLNRPPDSRQTLSTLPWRSMCHGLLTLCCVMTKSVEPPQETLTSPEAPSRSRAVVPSALTLTGS